MSLRKSKTKYVLPGVVLMLFTTPVFSQQPVDLVRDDLSNSDISRVKQVTRPTNDFTGPEKFEARQGGAGTSFKKVNRNAFSNPSQNLSFEQLQEFLLGNALFRKVWVSSPASTHASDGLGPLFNARSCQSCHLKDGRGHPPEGDRDKTSMLIRLARDARTDAEQAEINALNVLNFPDITYGGQLQDVAVQGLNAEAEFSIQYEEEQIELSGGEIVSLRKPTYSLSAFSHGPIEDDISLSPRVAPQMIGLGLIEAIHPADILAQVDEKDRDGDGVSGKAAMVREEASGKRVLGRFGWKASQPSLASQNAGAFNGDIGISSPLKTDPYGDCTELQKECLSMATGVQLRLGETEAPDPVLDLVNFYAANLAVPARRDVDDARVLAGKKLFYDIGCITCHTPKYVTRRDTDNKEHAFQLIWPYSDFLLHDMGEGLADGQSVGLATGREWRTPPLWGIGLTKTVNGHTFFLHDGRARNLTEAVLWHGGEAEAAKERFQAAGKQDRDALIKFLESL